MRPRHAFLSLGLRHALLIVALVALVAPTWIVALAAELDGVQLPDSMERDGKTLRLNGIGLRTYSILGIHIYVAGLYLEHPSTDADAILQSPETKLLLVRFLRNVSADASRNAWRTGLTNNCQAPCRLDPDDVQRFLAEVPAMHAGELYSILVTRQGAAITADGIPLGTIAKPQFATALLATFLGPAPASATLKAALLKGHD